MYSGIRTAFASRIPGRRDPGIPYRYPDRIQQKSKLLDLTVYEVCRAYSTYLLVAPGIVTVYNYLFSIRIHGCTGSMVSNNIDDQQRDPEC